MAHHIPEPKPHSSLSIEDGRGEELLSETDQVVLATDSQGNSLTLLEEYAQRRNNGVHPLEFAISLTCAAASLAFTALIYFSTQ